MTSPAKCPPKRPQWHFRSVGQYILVGLVIVVVGTVVALWVASSFSGDGASEVSIAEGAQVNVDEPSEVNIGEPPEINVNGPTEVIIKEPAEVIIEQPAAQRSAPPPETTIELTAGDCSRFAVYAQGRWSPMGTAVRSEPTIAAPQTDSIQPNVIISVDGWIRSDAPYPSNPAPWNENVWFRLTDRWGWVSFAGVRASSTHASGTDGPAGGGSPVELIDECELPSRTNG